MISIPGHAHILRNELADVAVKKGSSVQGSFSDGMIEKENRERNVRESSVGFFIFEEIIQIMCPFGEHIF